MTLKKFADKYQIPYHVVYNASYLVTPASREIYDRQYREEELKKAVRKMTVRRIRKFAGYLKKQQEILEKMKEE